MKKLLLLMIFFISCMSTVDSTLDNSYEDEKIIKVEPVEEKIEDKKEERKIISKKIIEEPLTQVILKKDVENEIIQIADTKEVKEEPIINLNDNEEEKVEEELKVEENINKEDDIKIVKVSKQEVVKPVDEKEEKGISAKDITISFIIAFVILAIVVIISNLIKRNERK